MESAFYDSKIRVNGQKVMKKSKQVSSPCLSHMLSLVRYLVYFMAGWTKTYCMSHMCLLGLQLKVQERGSLDAHARTMLRNQLQRAAFDVGYVFMFLFMCVYILDYKSYIIPAFYSIRLSCFNVCIMSSKFSQN